MPDPTCPLHVADAVACGMNNLVVMGVVGVGVGAGLGVAPGVARGMDGSGFVCAAGYPGRAMARRGEYNLQILPVPGVSDPTLDLYAVLYMCM